MIERVATMKITTWNIQSGATEAAMKEAIINLVANEADLVILTGEHDVDWQKNYLPYIDAQKLALVQAISEESQFFVISKMKQTKLSNCSNQSDIWLEVRLPEKKLTILGVHIAKANNIQEKETFWQQLFHYTHQKVAEKVVIIGNVNIQGENLGTVFKLKDYFQRFTFDGWVDAWRYFHPITYEYTWFSNAKKGLCLDFVILSPNLKELLTNAYHSPIQLGGKCLIVELEDFFS